MSAKVQTMSSANSVVYMQRAVAERVVAKAALTASLQGGEEHDQQVAVSWAAEADRKLGEAEAVSREFLCRNGQRSCRQHTRWVSQRKKLMPDWVDLFTVCSRLPELHRLPAKQLWLWKRLLQVPSIPEGSRLRVPRGQR